MKTFFQKNILEDISPFCGTTDTPILDFWWCLSWSTGVDPSLACFITCMHWIPQIHLWCDTYWPLGVQHGSCTILSTYLHASIQALVGHEPGIKRDVRRTTLWAMPDWLWNEMKFFLLFFSWNLALSRIQIKIWIGRNDTQPPWI